jgi:hypothetical protein
MIIFFVYSEPFRMCFSSLISSLCILKCDRLSISILYFTSNWCFNILWMCSFQHTRLSVSGSVLPFPFCA